MEPVPNLTLPLRWTCFARLEHPNPARAPRSLGQKRFKAMQAGRSLSQTRGFHRCSGVIMPGYESLRLRAPCVRNICLKGEVTGADAGRRREKGRETRTAETEQWPRGPLACNDGPRLSRCRHHAVRQITYGTATLGVIRADVSERCQVQFPGLSRGAHGGVAAVVVKCTAACNHGTLSTSTSFRPPRGAVCCLSLRENSVKESGRHGVNHVRDICSCWLTAVSDLSSCMLPIPVNQGLLLVLSRKIISQVIVARDVIWGLLRCTCRPWLDLIRS